MSGNAARAMKVGETIRIIVDGYKVRKYQTSEKAAATVSKTGLVTAKAGGEAKITITTTSKVRGKLKKLTLTLKITDPNGPKGVSIKQGKTASMKVGETLKLKAVLKPGKAKSVLKWTSDKPKVASVSKAGVVKALKKGAVKITITTYNTKKAMITVTITPPALKKIAFKEGAKGTVAVGKALKLTPVCSPTGAEAELEWKSGKPDIASVNGKGVVSGKKPGTATITATDKKTKKKASFKVTVKKSANKSGLTIVEGVEVTMHVGEKKDLNSTLPEELAEQALTWTSGDEAIVKVSKKGAAKALQTGTAVVTATAEDGESASITVNVVSNDEEGLFMLEDIPAEGESTEQPPEDFGSIDLQ